MKFYLAGPMRGYKHFNFPAFDMAARRLRLGGHSVLSPAENDREQGFDETLGTLDGFDMQAAILWDMQGVTLSDAIVLLPGWEKSKGTALELDLARFLNKSTYVYQETNDAAGFALCVLTDEKRVVNPATGGEKGTKPERYDLIPVGPLADLARHYGRGAKKYSDNNWRKGVSWSLNFAAAMRHMWAFWRGENNDPETGTPHTISAAWHMFALAEYITTHPELDDRYKT